MKKRAGQKVYFWERVKVVLRRCSPPVLESKSLRRFSEAKTPKALLYSWLAWQAEPGKPFGLAVKMGYLNKQAQAADVFVRWFQQVFRLEAAQFWDYNRIRSSPQ
jgi:hypothetical protein